jgi:hypothetical protein
MCQLSSGQVWPDFIVSAPSLDQVYVVAGGTNALGSARMDEVANLVVVLLSAAATNVQANPGTRFAATGENGALFPVQGAASPRREEA